MVAYTPYFCRKLFILGVNLSIAVQTSLRSSTQENVIYFKFFPSQITENTTAKYICYIKHIKFVQKGNDIQCSVTVVFLSYPDIWL